MSDAGDTFFTAIGCMDGRVQDPVAEFGREKFDVRFADTITEAGLVGLFQSNLSDEFVSNLKKKIAVSIEKHHSKGIIIHGHQECAGNPIDDETHKEHVRKAARFIRNFAPDTEVIPVFVVKKDGEWKALPL
ncbi:MAG: hypothetical protein US51_C0010G0002 [Microgenomates group bacterium GW2011_GWA2_37_6]|nr:MAG: hypothetical protein US51_C0010G0002 [Microgenomates group bacterium GW2011_GWA2_37_6]